MNVLLAALWPRILCCLLDMLDMLGMLAAVDVHSSEVIVARVPFASIAYTGSASVGNGVEI